jgi:hypothetical protein
LPTPEAHASGFFFVSAFAVVCKNRSVKKIRIGDNLRSKLRQKAKKRAARRINLPIVRSKRPGTLNLDNTRIFEIIDFP